MPCNGFWVLLVGLCKLWINETQAFKKLPQVPHQIQTYSNAESTSFNFETEMKPTYTNSVQYYGRRKKESLSYYCRLSMALSLNTLGRSLNQSRDTLMAGRGHSPMISSRFLLSKARLSITPRKDTRKRQLHYNTAQTRVTCFIWRIYHNILQN